MLSLQQLQDLGLASDLDSLNRHLVAAAEQLGFGLASAVLIRGSLHSGRAWVKSIGNTPAGFLEAQHSLDDTLRDPVMTALRSDVQPVVYDQGTYVEAGVADLWDAQAPFDYRCGVACSVHAPGHSFMLGIDRSSPVPTEPVERMRLVASTLMLTVHAQDAMQRLLTPEPAGVPVALDAPELETLRWAKDGFTAQRIGDLMLITSANVQRHQRSAARKLGASSVSGAVLRCIQGGLID